MYVGDGGGAVGNNFCAAPFIPARESLGQCSVFATLMFSREMLSIT